MRVLIVEDEIRLADALGQIMKEQKYTVDVVYDGQDGLDQNEIGILKGLDLRYGAKQTAEGIEKVRPK